MIRTGNEKLDNRNIELPVAAATKLRELTIAAVNSSGYAVAGSVAEGLRVAGCVMRYTDNSEGAAGDMSVPVRRGTFVWNKSGTIAKTDILKLCYIAGVDSVTLDPTGASVAGRILAVDDDGITVDMMDTVDAAEAAAEGEGAGS